MDEDEINTVLKEKCYDEALSEVNSMRLGQLISVINFSSETLRQIENLIIKKASDKYANLPDVGEM
tara:strand:+ start:567 stop:764 length:198 start_codon:yes stop_codon:yes gene_type:complete